MPVRLRCSCRPQRNSSPRLKSLPKGKTVDAKSILMVMSMGLVKGTEIVISAEGEDATQAVTSLVDLVNSKFGEE